MTPTNPWLRFFAGVVAAAIAIRVVVELLVPILGYLIAAAAVVGIVVLVRWWRTTRL